MPAESALTPKGEEMLAKLPAFMRRDPDVMGVIHPQAKEIERLEERLERIRTNCFPPKSEEELGLWEAIVGYTSRPPEQTVAQQQSIVASYLLTLLTSATGIVWQKLITAALGVGWKWFVHHDEGVIPALTVVVVVPYPEGSSLYAHGRAFARRVTQAHVQLTVTEGDGFVLDESELDEAVL